MRVPATGPSVGEAARATNAETGLPVTARLAETARGYRYDELPDGVVEVARHCVLDWLGVALAGFGEPVTRILREDALAEGGEPRATLLGTGEGVTARQAALVNGAAGHALDYDDAHEAMGGHPSAPVLPALLALSETEGLSGKDFLAAFVAGLETECRVGVLVMPGHYEAGWHATATVGTFGAAAACAHALKLDGALWAHAFGISGTSAAGLKCMFGTMSKPLHAGRAAQNGLAAAVLAARGLTASGAVLETDQGFGLTQTTTFSPEEALEGLGERFYTPEVLFKYHAACFFTHSSIEGILGLKERHGFGADGVASVTLRVPPVQLSACNIREPETPLEAKFSLRHAAALALSGAGTGEGAFAPEKVRDPALAALRGLVAVEAAGGFASDFASEVVVGLRDGRTFVESVDMSAPEGDLERQWGRLTAKFRGLAEPVVGEARAGELVATVSRMEGVEDVGEGLVALCVGERRVG